MSPSTTRSTWAWASRPERRRRPRLGAAAARPRHHTPPYHDLDGGLDAGLRRFVDEVEQPIRLALSIHAADPKKRSQLMPSTTAIRSRTCSPSVPVRPAPPPEGVRRVRDARRRERLTADARQLAALLGRDEFKVNLIPYNPTGPYAGSPRQAIAAFKAVLDHARIPATVRLTRGQDIEAACGQLANSTVRRLPYGLKEGN